MSHSVLCAAQVEGAALDTLLQRFGMRVEHLAQGQTVQGSYWGESEAGLVGNTLYMRDDTPIHSVLHEACHFICMDTERRMQLSRDAGGDYAEENAVCYLQIVLSECIPGMNRERMQLDMDAWGYTFRLGSARAWFENDADDARAWLLRERLIDVDGAVTWRVRD
jgi:hypothetical protein